MWGVQAKINSAQTEANGEMHPAEAAKIRPPAGETVLFWEETLKFDFVWMFLAALGSSSWINLSSRNLLGFVVGIPDSPLACFFIFMG